MPAANAMAIGDSLVEQVARTIRTELGAEVRRREQRQQTRSTDAWVLVQRAERLHKQGDSAAAAGDTVAFAALYAQADSQAEQAETLDRRWTAPIVLRAGLAYGRSRKYFEPGAVRPWVQQGLAHVERALAIDREDPEAQTLRGNLRYWGYLVGIEPNATRADSLRAAARRDLEDAIRFDNRQAGAYSTLSHLCANDPNCRATEQALFAGEALRRDAFLSNASTIQSRLFFAYYDLGDSLKAAEACDQGLRRFRDDFRFTECRLWLLTMGRQPSSVGARAWALADSLIALVPPSDSAFYRRSSRLMVAAVLARGGLADSALRVAASVQRNSDVDPSADLANIQAFVYTLLDRKGQAVEQLRTYLTVNPQRRNSLATDPGWWYRPLQGDRGYELLVAASR
jgi:serine/threonine-protein kinase